MYTNSYVAGPEGLWFVCGFFFISGAPKGLTDSGFGVARDRACDPWFTRHSAYPQQHGGFLTDNNKRLCLQRSQIFSRMEYWQITQRWERADLLALLCEMFSRVFIIFPYVVLGQKWY